MADGRSIDELHDVVVGLTRSVDDDRELSKQRIKKHDRAIKVAIGFGVLGLLVGALGLLAADEAQGAADKARAAAEKAQEAIDLVNEQRAQARPTACNADNDTAAKINGLNIQIQSLLTSILSDSSSQAAVDFVAEQVAGLEAIKVRYRVCTTEAIEAFYESGGTEGLLPPGEVP